MYEIATYGTFTFDLHRITVDETVLYGSNGIDQVGVDYRLDLSGIISAPNEVAFKAAIQQAECQLNTPRQAFSSSWSQTQAGHYTTLISLTPEADIAWGPKPQGIKIREIIGGRSALISFSLIAKQKKCFDSGCNEVGVPLWVLSVSRRFDFSVDENGYTTRTVSGKILVDAQSQAAANGNKPADWYRNFAVFGCPQWYRRIHQQWTQNEDGTEVDYSYTDKEQEWVFPRPVSSGHATWRVTTSAFGALANFVLAGSFCGTTGCTKADILQQISLLAANRFPPDNAPIVYNNTECMYEEDIYGENRVTFQLSGSSAAGSVGTDWTAGGTQPVFKTFGIAPPGNDDAGVGGANQGSSQPIGTYGGDGANTTSGVIAPALAPYDACNPPSGLPSGGPGIPGSSTQVGITGSPNTNIPSGQVPTQVTPGDSPSPASVTPQNQAISAAHKANPFISYYEEISYEFDNKMAIFYPKVVGAKPVVQQTSNPALRIIQSGYSCQWGTSAQAIATANQSAFGSNLLVAPPVFSGAVLKYSSINPGSPTPVGVNGANGGTTAVNQYKTSWRYVMEISTPVSSVAALAYPICPQRGTQEAIPGPFTQTSAGASSVNQFGSLVGGPSGPAGLLVAGNGGGGVPGFGG